MGFLSARLPLLLHRLAQEYIVETFVRRAEQKYLREIARVFDTGQRNKREKKGVFERMVTRG
jgi:hypothetical protein